MADEASAPLSKGYLHACQRAELLGLQTPSEAEWLASEECQREAVETEAHEDAVAQELSENDENMRHISGGLDELNTILSATQKKINKFKTVCGSLGTLLKARVQSQSGSRSDQSTASEQQQEEAQVESETERECEDKPYPVMARKPDLNAKVESHLDKLDSLMKKAENAQYSMKHQTSQMKQFFK
ncbi:PREDICTED: uncharacterized protein LOC105361984 [Ceratosolen solmsi marchali]|uniref:Uncharacterized protein LOC105361984 n=1 Tax=Ceratosolen solmsi marchali TaxID=326594 RepID=A0AAJ7DV69_9HYME|nr:PREDICTED: uncharacterized protein LOC105361984 [Ceratosolen solmsi marchali]